MHMTTCVNITALHIDGNTTELCARINHPCLETGILEFEGIGNLVVLLVIGNKSICHIGLNIAEVIVLRAAVQSLDLSVQMLAGCLVVIVIKLVSKIERKCIGALLITGNTLMGSPVVHAIVGLGISCNIGTAKQTFVFLEMLEEFGQIIGGSIYGGRILTVKLICTTLDYLFCSSNSLIIIIRSIAFLHVCKALLYCNIAGINGGTRPVLALRCGPKGSTGFHTQSRVLVYTHLLRLLGRKQVCCLLELVQYPIPGILFSRTGNIQTLVLSTVILLIK